MQNLVEDFCDNIFKNVVRNQIILLTGVIAPSSSPTSKPSSRPTEKPTIAPTSTPSVDFPSDVPTQNPTGDFPTMTPSISLEPSTKPSISSPPTISNFPTNVPTAWPTDQPTISSAPVATPSFIPTKVESQKPTKLSQFKLKSDTPSTTPSSYPTGTPSLSPTSTPTTSPSQAPTRLPSVNPSNLPSMIPSVDPTTTADLAADVMFYFLIRIQEYYPAILVNQNLNEQILTALSDIVIADVNDRSNTLLVDRSHHVHHNSPYHRYLDEEELRYFLDKSENLSFTDVVCPDSLNEYTEACVVVTSNIQVYASSITLVNQHIQDVISSKMLPHSTEFQEEIRGRDSEGLPRDLTVEYLGEGTFTGSGSSLVPYAEARPAIPEPIESNELSQTEIAVISIACALTLSLAVVSRALWRQRKKEAIDDKDDVGEYIGEADELEKSQTNIKKGHDGIYGDALAAIKDQPLSDIPEVSNLANNTASLSQSYDDEMEQAIQAGDWTKVQVIAKSISTDDPISKSPTYDVLKIDDASYSTGSSLSSDERKKAAKLDELIDRGDWDAVASLASFVTASSMDKSLTRSANSSVGGRSQRSMLSHISDSAKPMIIDYEDDKSHDNHSTTSSLSGDDQSRKSNSSASGISTSSRRSAKSFKAQVLSLLERGAPQEMSNADEMIRAFENNEDELLDMLKEKVRQKESFRDQVVELLEKSAPEEVDNADAMIEAFSGSEEELLEVLQSMHERKVAEKQRLANQNLAKSDAKMAAVQKRQQQQQKLTIQEHISSTSTQERLVSQAPPAATPKPKIVSSTQASKETSVREEKSSPSKSNNNVELDLEQAIDAGDWAVVAARAASLANDDETSDDENNSARYSSSSMNTDDQRLGELEGMIENEDWNALMRDTRRS